MSVDHVTSLGLHTRAGNAMNRTRDGLLDAALDCLARDGSRGTTMAAVALSAGVAKATLYNHFRTKAEVWSALVDREVRRVYVSASHSEDPAERLDRAAVELGQLPAIRALAAAEPATLVPLLTPGESAEWTNARVAVAALLGSQPSDPVVELALRWLVSQVLAPQSRPVRLAAAQLLIAAGLASRTPKSDAGE